MRARVKESGENASVSEKMRERKKERDREKGRKRKRNGILTMRNSCEWVGDGGRKFKHVRNATCSRT